MARQNFGFGGGANMQQLMRQAQHVCVRGKLRTFLRQSLQEERSKS